MLIYGPFEIDEEELSVRRAGEPVVVRRRVLQTIVYLMRNAGRLVTHDEIVAGPWRGVKVSTAALHRTIMLARRALEAPGLRNPIATVHGIGFRFIGDVVDRLDRAPQSKLVPDHAPATRLVERDRELAALGAALDRARSGRGSVVFVLGSAGIGKTALVEELAAQAAQADVAVARGWVWENGGAPSLWPWIEVVRSLRASVGPLPEGVQVASEVDQDIAALLSGQELNDAGDDAPQMRFRLFDTVTRYLGELARRRAVLVIVEDIHAADEASVLLLEFMQARIRSCPVLIVVTSRSLAESTREVGATATLQRLLGGATGSDSDRVTPAQLSPAGVEAMLRQLGYPDVSREIVAAVQEASEGNPLLIRELMCSGVIDRDVFTHVARMCLRRIPERMAETIRVRLSRLDASSRRLLDVAAVIGREFPSSLLTLSAGLVAEDGLVRLEQPLRVGLVEPVPGRAGTYRFTHGLIREVFYAELSPLDRADLHARVARELERTSGGDGDVVFQIAAHFSMASPGLCRREAVHYSFKAAERARQSYAYEVAASHYRYVLDLTDPVPAECDVPRRTDLLTRLAWAEALAGRLEQAIRTLEDVMRIAKLAGDPRGFSGAVLTAFALLREQVWTHASFRASLQEALAWLPEPGGLRAQLLAAEASTMLFEASPAERLRRADEAIEMATRADDKQALLTVLSATHAGVMQPSVARDALNRANQMKDLALTLGDMVAVLDAQLFRLQGLLDLGQGSAFERELAEYGERAKRVRHPAHLWSAHELAATRLLHRGKAVEAEEMLRQHLPEGVYANALSAEGDFGGHLYVISRHVSPAKRRALADEALEIGRRVLVAFPTLYIWQLGAVVQPLEHGDWRRAAQAFEVLAPRARTLEEDQFFLASLTVVGDLALALGRTDVAEHALERLSEYAGLQVTCNRIWWGPLSFFLGRLAKGLGQDRRSARYFEQAIEESRVSGSQLYLAWSQVESEGKRGSRSPTIWLTGS